MSMKAQHHSQHHKDRVFDLHMCMISDNCVMLHCAFRLVLLLHDYIVLYCARLNMWCTFDVRGRLPRMIGTCVLELDINHLLSWFL